MKLTINGKETEVPAGLSVAALLAHQKVKMPDMVTVELNGDILERKSFESTGLKENDRVEFLYFMGGGGGARRLLSFGWGGPACCRPQASEEGNGL